MQSTVPQIDVQERLPGIRADARRIGPFLFISTQTAADPVTGKFTSRPEDLSAEDRAQIEAHHHVSYLEWPITAQTWAIYANIQRILAAYGGTLDNLVRTNTFFRDLTEFPAMERTRAILLKTAPPASTVLQITDRGLHPDVRLMVDALAVLPDPGYPQIVKASVSSDLSATAHFSTALSAGQFIWPSGQTAAHPVTRDLIQGLADLPADAGWLVTGNKHLDTREGRILAQVWRTYDNLRLILHAAGGTLNDIVKETIWLRDMRYLAAVERVREYLFPNPTDAPASSVMQIGDLGRTSDTLIEIDIVGLIPSHSGWRKEPILSPTDTIRPLLQGPVAVKAGPLVFTSEIVGLANAGQPITSLQQLDGSSRHLQNGRPYRELAAVGQAELAVQSLASLLSNVGTSLEQIAFLNIYTSDFSELPEVERLLALRLGNTPPAGRTIAVNQVDPRPGCHVKIEAVALTA